MKPELLVRGASKLGIALTESQQAQFLVYFEQLRTWNQRINLTSVDSWHDVQTVHFLDSISVSALLELLPRCDVRLLDVGTGAGFPGLPLKIVFPHIGVTLIESVSKKVRFLRALIDTLGLDGVDVVDMRAEDAGRRPELREKFDLVVARALASIDVFAELTLPFVRLGGIAVAQKKGNFYAELDDARKGVEALGGGDYSVHWLNLTGVKDPRALVSIPKLMVTPNQFPRRVGVPRKRPLRYLRGKEVD